MTVLVDPRLSDRCKAALAVLGANVAEIPPCDRLAEPVCGHPDLIGAKLPDGSLLLTGEYYRASRPFWDRLALPIILTEEMLGASYPEDVLFDALPMGETLYGKDGAVSSVLQEKYSRFVAVKQGYARCSVAKLSEKAAVTADLGLAKALVNDGVDVLTIREGHIALPGYDHGFIGGAGGPLTDGVYVFFGNLLSHPDGEAILRFCEGHKISAVSLSEEPLSDHGGLLVFR